MHTASLFFGTSVIAIAFGLESYRRLHERQTKSPPAPTATLLDQDYQSRRHRSRGWTNTLVALIGALAMAAGIAGSGYVWLALWAAIPLILAVIVSLAFADAFRTQRYLQEKHIEIEKEAFGGALQQGSPTFPQPPSQT